MGRLALLFALLVVLFSSHSVLGTIAYCDAGCERAADALAYEPCSKETTYYGCHCSNPAFLGTFALCVQDRCDDNESLWIVSVQDCVTYGGIHVPSYRDLLANATQFVQHFPANITEAIHAPVRIPDALWDPIYRTTSTFYYNMRDGTLFGWAIAVLSGITCLFAGVQYLYLCQWSHTSLPSELEGRVRGRSPPLTVYIKKHILMPAFLGNSNAGRPSVFGLMTLSIPTRLQTVLVVCYVGLNVVATCVRYRLFVDNTFWPGDIPGQLTRYIADRSGILSFANIPLLITFAGRNNILIWITGSSFATFNVFHKWIGRVCVAHAFIHSVAYTVVYWRESGAAAMNEAFIEPYLRYGAVATTAGCLLLFQGMHIFRHWAYETFLVLHIVLALAFIVGCWYHVHLIPYDNYLPWLYASVALWAFDRAVRILRIVIYNLRWSRSHGWRVTNAAITHLDLGFIRLDITPLARWKFEPGQYLYLYMVGSVRDRPWESHPFTIYSYHVPEPTTTTTSSSPAVRSSSEQEKKQELGSQSSSSSSTTSDGLITLYVRPYGGMTSRLANLAKPGEVVLHPILVEGPYGHGLPLHHFDNVTLIAGGVGITALMPYFNQLAAVASPTQHVHMIWIVHELARVKGIHQDILSLSSPSKTVSIYVTAQNKAISEAESRLLLDLDQDNSSILTSVSIALGTGRPVCHDLIAETAERAGSLAVAACGPGGMIDDCRTACVEMLSTNRATIEFFSEVFGW